MKSFILLACALVCANALDQALIDELHGKIDEYGVVCAEQENAPPEDIEALINHRAPSTHEGKCVIFCVSKKLNMMNDAGEVTVPTGEWIDKIKDNDPDEFNKIKDVYNLCKERVTNEDKCGAALEMLSCGKYEGQKAGVAIF